MRRFFHLYGGFWGNVGYPLVAFVVVTAVVVLVVEWLLPAQNIWMDMVQSRASGPSSQYCERDHLESLIRQPSNTWSNLAYMAYGFICIGMGIMDAKRSEAAPNFVSRAPAISLLYGLTLTYLCWGSFLFHASLTRVGQHWDMAATYAVTVLPSVILLVRLAVPHWAQRAQVGLVYGLSTVVFFMLYQFKWHMNSSVFMPGFILALVVLVLAYRFGRGMFLSLPFGLLAFGCMGLAFFIWIKDVRKEWCNPDAVVQGHAIWHFLTGLSALMTYLLLRTERSKPSQHKETPNSLEP